MKQRVVATRKTQRRGGGSAAGLSASSCRCKHLFLVTQRDKHDALHVHFALCDTGFNSSWNLRTRRCEDIRTDDRDYVGQIASSRSMRTPVLGDRAFGYPSMLQTRRKACASPLWSRFAAVVEREKTPDTKGSNISMSQERQWCHNKTDTLHGQRCPMEPYVESNAPSL